MKSVKYILVILITCFAFSSMLEAQVKKLPYPYVSISPMGGVFFPVGTFGDNFKAGGNVGLDISYRVNKEVGFYGKFSYFFIPHKTLTAAVTPPDAKYLEFSAGPRYFFTSRNLKSSIFVEAGVGAYNFKQDSYTIPGTPSITILEVSDTKIGVNGGIGAILTLSNLIDIIVKTKYHNVFTTDGSTSFVTAAAGLDFKLK